MGAEGALRRAHRPPITTIGWRSGSGWALRINCWTIQGTLPSPNSRKLSVPATIWGRDVFDLDLWQNLMVGNNTTDFVVLRKM